VGVLAGSYPALVLSRLRPVQILKGKAESSFTGAGIRQTLVVLQFAIAIALITGSLIVANQMAFISGKALGFDQEEVVVLNMRGEALQAHYPALRQRLLQNPDVIQVSKAGNLFDGHQGSVPIFPEGGENLESHAMNIYGTYYDYFETLGINIVQGRVHSLDFPADSASGIVLNQAAADLLEATVPGWENPLGKHLGVGAITEGPVIGVVENFHFASLHDEIAPLVLYNPPTLMDHVIVRVRPGNTSALLTSLERDWQAVAPALPFSYTFLNDHIQQLYEDEARFTRLTTVFTLLTILLACLGLYGLVAFVTQLRTKEIGIRKVLGASVPGIVALLSTRFLGYIVLANLLAWPLAYFGTRHWLDNFAYRIDPGFGVYLLAGVLTLGVALLTMSYQSIRAALADPVKSLRYE
jgi:putative ABC transport system permease protein